MNKQNLVPTVFLFLMAHSIAVDKEGSVYVGDITGARVQKFVLTSPLSSCIALR
jgi:NHL repeat